MLDRYRRPYSSVARAGLIAIAIFCSGATDKDRQRNPPDYKGGAERGEKIASRSVTAPSAIRGDSNADGDKQETAAPSDKERLWGLTDERWIAVLTAVLTSATIALGAFTYFLWRATLKAVREAADGIKAAQRSASAAEKAVEGGVAALEHAQKSSERELRAYVFVTEASARAKELGGPATIIVKVENTGKTPAYGVKIYGGFAFIKYDTISFDLLDFDVEVSVMDLGASGSYTKIDYAQSLDPAQLYAWKDGKMALYAHGEIRYKDAFGVERVTRYRHFSGGPYGIHFFDPPGGEVVIQMHPHPEGNEAT